MNGSYQAASILVQLVRNVGLVSRLMIDGRVPLSLKLIVFAVLAYIVSPLDLLPDVFFGMGQLDDLAILLIGLKMFIDLCPKDVVDEITGKRSPGSANGNAKQPEFVDASYRIVDEDKGR